MERLPRERLPKCQWKTELATVALTFAVLAIDLVTLTEKLKKGILLLNPVK